MVGLEAIFYGVLIFMEKSVEYLWQVLYLDRAPGFESRTAQNF